MNFYRDWWGLWK